MLKMLFWSAPTQEKYSRSVLKILIFGPRRTFFPKPSQTHPKTSPNHSQTLPKTSQNWRKNDPDPTKKVTRGSRESNPPPPASRSQDHPTRLISPQNIASVKISYVSKIETRAGAFSEPKIARRVLPSPKFRPRGVLLQPKWQLFWKMRGTVVCNTTFFECFFENTFNKRVDTCPSSSHF